jgi:hypothetical protein
LSMELSYARLVTIVYAKPDGPRMIDIAIYDYALDPGDLRQPGDIILHDDDFGVPAFAAALEWAARVLRGAS